MSLESSANPAAAGIPTARSAPPEGPNPHAGALVPIRLVGPEHGGEGREEEDVRDRSDGLRGEIVARRVGPHLLRPEPPPDEDPVGEVHGCRADEGEHEWESVLQELPGKGPGLFRDDCPHTPERIHEQHGEDVAHQESEQCAGLPGSHQDEGRCCPSEAAPRIQLSAA